MYPAPLFIFHLYPPVLGKWEDGHTSLHFGERPCTPDYAWGPSCEGLQATLSSASFIQLQEMPHLLALGLKISDILRIGLTDDGHRLHYLQAIALKPDNLARIVGK